MGAKAKRARERLRVEISRTQAFLLRYHDQRRRAEHWKMMAQCAEDRAKALQRSWDAVCHLAPRPDMRIWSVSVGINEQEVRRLKNECGYAQDLIHHIAAKITDDLKNASTPR